MVLYVPNVPCGVERSSYLMKHRGCSENVPNVPCGVERMVKVIHNAVLKGVPNVPCGVESGEGRHSYKVWLK